MDHCDVSPNSKACLLDHLLTESEKAYIMAMSLIVILEDYMDHNIPGPLFLNS